MLFTITLAFLIGILFGPWGDNIFYFLILIVVGEVIYAALFKPPKISHLLTIIFASLGFIYSRWLMDYNEILMYKATYDD